MSEREQVRMAHVEEKGTKIVYFISPSPKTTHQLGKRIEIGYAINS